MRLQCFKEAGRPQQAGPRKISLEDLYREVKKGALKELKIVLKAEAFAGGRRVRVRKILPGPMCPANVPFGKSVSQDVSNPMSRSHLASRPIVFSTANDGCMQTANLVSGCSDVATGCSGYR